MRVREGRAGGRAKACTDLKHSPRQSPGRLFTSALQTPQLNPKRRLYSLPDCKGGGKGISCTSVTCNKCIFPKQDIAKYFET